MFGLLILLRLSCLHLCNQVTYVTFNTNLNLYSKKKYISKSPQYIWLLLSIIMLGFLLCEFPKEPIQIFIICINPYFASVVSLILKFSRIISWAIFDTLSIYIFAAAVILASYIICVIVFQICCHLCKKRYQIGWLLYSSYCQMILI